jgi:RNA polymerase sigma-70 factor (ECF subfamily)
MATVESQGVPDGEPTDQSLLEQFRRGSQDAATRLYFRYAQRLLRLVKAQCAPDLARNVDAEDLVQSIFGSFFRGASQGYYEVPPGEQLWRLLLVIALNKIRTAATFLHADKRDVRRTTGGLDVEQVLSPLTADGDPAFLRLVLDDALGRLSPDHRAMVELRLEGYEVAEIARQMGRAKRTVERILQEARQKLHALLDEED